METRKDIEEQLEGLRRQREVAEKTAQEFCQTHTSRLEQKNFDAVSFLDGLRKLDERTFKFAIEFLIRNKSFWQEFSVDELKSFVDYTITTKWFEEDNYFSDIWKQDFFDAVTKNSNGINAISSIYKNTATKNIKASIYITKELAKSENGRTELLDILQIDDGNIQKMALNAIAEYCVTSDVYSADVRDRNPQYIDTIRSFLFHPNKELSSIAIKALHRGKLLTINEVIKLMEAGGDLHTTVGINSLFYLGLEADNAKALISLIVKVLEHNKTEMSNAALESIARAAREHSRLISDEIIDTLILRKSNHPKEFFNTSITTSALRETFKYNPRLPGEVLHKLCEVAYSSTSDVRNRAIFVAMTLNKKEFIALVNERRESNPSVAKAILNTITGTLDTDQIANQISQTDPKDIQQNAANQITVLAKYYENGLSQAKVSFNWAIAITIFSILSFIVAVLLFVNNTDKTGTVIAAVGGALTQLVAGTLLLIYRRTLSQLDNYTLQMSTVQNYLLANSFIESLEGDVKAQARMELIKTVANSTSLTQ